MAGSRRAMTPNYMTDLISYVEQDSKLVVGVHSGTSADGPSIVIARVSGSSESARAEVLAHRVFTYPPELRQLVLECSDRSTATVDGVVQADMAVGEFFADAISRTVTGAGFRMEEIALVASSGQITYQVIPGERPEHMTCLGREYMGMLDLGEGSVIALRTGVITVTTLRRKDNCVGGFGAPMVPFGDWVSFRTPARARAVWNIGGISNVTLLPPNAAFDEVTAFDAGPGNMLIDQVAARASRGVLAYDKDGLLASGGRVEPLLVEEYMRGSFIQQSPPKAAARQTYGAHLASDFWDAGVARRLSGPDIVASATMLTVESLAFAQETFVDPALPEAELVFAGGGVLNPTLMRWLSDRMPHRRLRRSDEFGLPVEAREALAMVLVANETVHGRPSNCVSATGASQSVVQGKIDIPS